MIGTATAVLSIRYRPRPIPLSRAVTRLRECGASKEDASAPGDGCASYPVVPAPALGRALPLSYPRLWPGALASARPRRPRASAVIVTGSYIPSAAEVGP